MLRGDGYDVLGVSIGGSAPVGRIHLELESGVTALYGRNGAGKTRVLHAIAEALAGHPPTGDGLIDREVTVRVDPQRGGDPIGAMSWLGTLFVALSRQLENVAVRRLRSDGADEASDHLRDGPKTLQDVLSALADMDLWLESPVFLDRLGREGLVTVRTVRSGVRCGPAASYDCLIEGEAEELLWDSILVADLALTEQFDCIANPDRPMLARLDLTGILADRSLDPRALADHDRERLASETYRPQWCGYSIGNGGPLGQSPIHLVGWPAEPESLGARSLRAIEAASTGHLIEAVADEDVLLSPGAGAIIERLAQRANLFLGLTLLEAPLLRLWVGHPDDWLRAAAPRWEALDRASRAWVPLADLSSAQCRWANLAVDLALSEAEAADRPIVVILDEPEGALHRTAERHLVNGLKALSTALNGAAIIVATHSPAFLSDVGVRQVHVHRVRDGLALASTVTVGVQGDLQGEISLDDLGLGRADALHLARVVLAVEGPHDEAVLEAIAAETIVETRSLLVRMHGAKHAPAILDAQILMTMTDAHILVVVDNIASRQLIPIWEALRALADAGDQRGAQVQVDRVRRLPGGEALWLSQLAERALALGRLDRLSLFGLGKPDIIFYLDPTHFGLDEPWATLHREWKTGHKAGDDDFKTWLRKTKGAKISTGKIGAAARALVPLPRDLEELKTRVIELSFAAHL